MNRTSSLLALLALLLAIPATACSGEDEPEGGECHVSHYPVRGTSYSEKLTFCGAQAACDSYCASLKGNDDYDGCGYELKKYCFGGAIPAASAAKPYCALMRKMGCGSSFQDESFEPYCDAHCSARPGSSESDYLGDTQCFTQYGNDVVTGTSCDDALAKLTAR